MKTLYVLPGRLAVSKDPVELTTILGSCVSVVLYDPLAKCAGLNHYLLTKLPQGEVASGRYGECAIPMLIQELERLGASRRNLKAKVYGGGAVLTDVQIGIGVGKKNIDFAFETLANLGIPVVEQNVGGELSRKITINVSDFNVIHRFINQDENSQVDISGRIKLEPIRKVKVGIVDDSATVRSLFQNVFSKHGLDVVGVAADPYQAREMLVKHKPDVITLDIEMPKMNGVVFLEKLMKHMPLPVVMVSSLGSQGEAALRALELGAIEFIHKPSQYDPAVIKQLGETLVEKVKAAASQKVLANRSQKKSDTKVEYAVSGLGIQGLKLIAVGGNTGSQDGLKAFLQSLNSDTPPVIVANSTLSSFIEAYIQKIKKNVSVRLSVVKENTHLTSGNVYFAPADNHIVVETQSNNFYAKLRQLPPVNGQKPSSDVLMASIASCERGGALGVLMSGFGRDGVDGLAAMRASGNVTLVEDPDLCAFPYGPQQAINLGIVDYVKSAGDFANTVMEIRNKRVA
ncbi:MAG: hypothetical protein A4S09_03620 [Proteobacteria bacterium SG_bin7]|nr:MAG: hypothetical protein A4S09_03620 [Proteobacteria bacterium SG_bin7]